MIVEHPMIGYLHEKVDHRLCDVCNLVRTADREMDDTPRLEVVVSLLSHVREDIGRINQEHRDAFHSVDQRLTIICDDIEELKMARATAAGRSDGIRGVLGIIVTLATLLGGVVAWLIAHLPWTQSKP